MTGFWRKVEAVDPNPDDPEPILRVEEYEDGPFDSEEKARANAKYLAESIVADGGVVVSITVQPPE